MEERLERVAEARRGYLEAVDSLGDGGWGKPSLCAGWTATDVVAHVAGGDRLMRAAIHGATGQDPTLLAGLPSEMAETASWGQAISAWEPARLREAARQESKEMFGALREITERAPESMLRLPFGEIPLPRAANLRTAEYVIHGYDLTPATGRAMPVPAWYIDATLPRAAEMMTRTHQRSPHNGRAASFHLHRTDGEGEWIMRAEAGRAWTDAGHGHADVAFRGPAAGLYWLLIGRGRPQDHAVEVHGDPVLAAAFKEWFPGP